MSQAHKNLSTEGLRACREEIVELEERAWLGAPVVPAILEARTVRISEL